jgi:plastocyanin
MEPVVNVPSNISLSTPDNSGRTTTFSVSASDNVGVTSGPICSPSSGSQFPIGTTTVTCFATDSAGNMGSGTFTVTVIHNSALPTVVTFFDGVNDATEEYFTPNTLTINVGDTVTWLYSSGSGYNYHRIYGSFTGGPHIIGDKYVTYEHTFNQIGTYEYTDHVKGWCQNLSNLNPTTCPIGTIVVVESGAPPPTTPPPDTTPPPADTTPADTTPADTTPADTTPADTTPADTAAAAIVIPDWIKLTAGWWNDDSISDSTFVVSLQWLITNGIMTIPPTEQGVGSGDVIPGWIKFNAGWWADGSIDDSTFVTGLQWLITNGVMVIG